MNVKGMNINMIIGRHVAIIKNKNKVILANRYSGEWIRISTEVYKIILDILATGKIVDELKNDFLKNEDFIFMKNIFNTLYECGLLCEKNSERVLENKIVSLQLTNRCNLRCKHCCVDAGEKKIKELTTIEMKKVLDKIIEWNPINIMLSGGEPMIRTDFFELLDYLSLNYTGNIILSTNSLLINEKKVDTLVKKCKHFEISIDGVDEETCATVRGKGVFEKVCSNIKLLKEHGAKQINLSMVFSDKNEHLKSQFYKLNEQLGTNPVCRIFSAVGRGAINKELFTNKNDDETYIPKEYLSKNYEKPFSIGICSAGKRELFIGCDGNVYPCPNYSYEQCILGNVLEIYSLNELTKKTVDQYVCNYVANMQPINLPQCQKCPVKLFCWTCPGELLDIKTEAAFKMRCQSLKPVLMHRVWDKEVNF